MKKTHESYGMVRISRYTGGNGQFFGSDLVHNGGISITISKAEKEVKYSSEWYHAQSEVVRIELTNNQFVDAITSGMNTSGVPCTIKKVLGESVPQIDHVEDKKERFSNDMTDTHKEYYKRIDAIMSMLDGNVGKRKSNEIRHELEVLRNHIGSNTNFVMKCFDESMEKTITEAKHSVANYIDQKVHSLGIEGLKKELQVSIEPKHPKNKTS